MARRISILGSTGSVGQSTLDLIRSAGPDMFNVVALTANTNVKALSAQALEFQPECVALADPSGLAELQANLSGTGIRILCGPEALIEAGAWPSDLIVGAIVGAAGLAPSLAAAEQGTILALANKECLVSAGDVFLRTVKRAGTTLLPVDSEHNAIFQVLNADRPDTVRRLILTASGGPFRRHSLDQLQQVSKAEALDHPVWDMGAKISIDSATLMNKGLELIEASYLFGFGSEQIEIIIHPQSIIHSMVEYGDGSVLAQMGVPDMRVPIAYCLAWPERMQTNVASLDFHTLGQLVFEPPDETRFPALALSRQALCTGGRAPTVLNAANEVAVAAFLAGQIGFMSITACIEEVLQRMAGEAGFSRPANGLEDVLEIDRRARFLAGETLEKKTG